LWICSKEEKLKRRKRRGNVQRVVLQMSPGQKREREKTMMKTLLHKLVSQMCWETGKILNNFS